MEGHGSQQVDMGRRGGVSFQPLPKPPNPCLLLPLQLSPITQLYVSVDAATPESLKAIDRPLFGDFWERFTACLSALKDRNQRTVYR